MKLYMYLYMELFYMFSMELLLAGTYFKFLYILKEAGRLSVEYNILFILERLSGYTDDWKELDRIIRFDLHN